MTKPSEDFERGFFTTFLLVLFFVLAVTGWGILLARESIEKNENKQDRIESLEKRVYELERREQSEQEKGNELLFD